MPDDAKFCTSCGKKFNEDHSSNVSENSNLQQTTVIVSVITILLIGGIVAYCLFGRSSNFNRDICDVDSTQLSADSISTSIDIKDKYFGDGATFEVRGHVKSVDEWDFDKEGRYKPSADWMDVKRNSKGQIIEIDPNDPGYHPHFKYNSDGMVAEIIEDWCAEGKSHGLDLSEASSFTHTYKYDSEGFVCSETMKVKFDEGNYVSISNPKTLTLEFQYTVLAKDSHGNWTKRRIQGEGVELSYDDGYELAGYADSMDEDSTENCVYYAKKKVNYVEERTITYYGENSSNASSKSSSHSYSSSSNTSSNSNSTKREQELLEENERLLKEWTRYENSLTKAMKEFDYNYKHGYQVVQPFSDMQFCVNKLDEIADALSRIDSSSGSIFKDKVKKYQKGLEYCKEHSGYY